MQKKITLLILLAAMLIVAPATAQTFDNDGGGVWKEYVSFPITVTPVEYAQYKIVINGTNWTVYNVTGSVEATGTNSNFWNLVNSGGADIRVFNQSSQLYFWIESWDYTNQTAVIWVNLTAGSMELNIAYGNPSALPSAYEDPTQVFEFYDDFSTDPSTRYTFTADAGTNPFSWDSVNQILTATGSSTLVQAHYTNNVFTLTDGIVELDIVSGQDGGFVFRFNDQNNLYLIAVYDSTYSSTPETIKIFKRVAGTWTQIGVDYSITNPAGTWHKLKFKVKGTLLTIWWDGNLVVQDLDLGTDFSSGKIGARIHGATNAKWDNIKVYKAADPADFGTPIVKLFQKKFGTKTIYVNVTYLGTLITNRYNPTAYYGLEDKPQINVTSQLPVSGVNATHGANISIELINFVTLDKVVYNGTDVTVNLTYQGTITNSTTGYIYNVYNFTTYENGTLEIYGHVSNEAYNTTYELDGEIVDVFNTTAVIGEPLKIILPHIGNVSIGSLKYIGVSSVTISTKDLGTGAKTLTVTIEDPENFTVGYKYGTINIDWGKVYFNVTDLQGKPLAKATYGFFNRNFSILSTDPMKLYAGDNEIDVYFHGVRLKSLVIYLNHSNNGLTLNVSVNATQFKDYRNVTRIIASPNYFEVVNQSSEYPYSVVKLVNVSGTVVIDYTSSAPTSVEVSGAVSYEYIKPVLKITANGNVTVTDLYKLSVQIRDRLGNSVNFYITVNGIRVDATNGLAAKLLKPSWYEVVAPTTINGFELWKFNGSSNRMLVEVNASDVSLPTAEYRVPTKIESKEVRITSSAFWWLPIPFLAPKQNENVTVVRLEGSLKDFYNAPVAGRTVEIEIASKNLTRVYNVTTDRSGNFRLEVDMAKGVEYTVTYSFGGDDVYVETSSSKSFLVEQLLPAPPAPTPTTLVVAVVLVALGAGVAAIVYMTKKKQAVARTRIESEFRFFRRLK